jgi:hypothetical protein
MNKVRFYKTIEEPSNKNKFNGVIETLAVVNLNNDKLNNLLQKEKINNFDLKQIKSLIPCGELFPIEGNIIGNAQDISEINTTDCDYVFKLLPKNLYNFFDNFESELTNYCNN